MSIELIVANMKCESLNDAYTRAIPILSNEKIIIGKLVPVGNWIFGDISKIEKMTSWRQRAKKMFLTQFQSTLEGTTNFLRNVSIGKPDRLLFLIYDDTDKFVGHFGLASISDNSFELDNLMRGTNGGHPRLIYFSEIALLKWSFENLNCHESIVGVLSYNWMVLDLHAEIGFKVVERVALSKQDKDGFISHSFVEKENTNTNYDYVKMVLKREEFYNSDLMRSTP